MKIAVLGTGSVGQTLAAKLDSIGHGVKIGTRDPAATMARDKPDNFGKPPFRVWAEAHPGVGLATLADAAAHGEVVINALAGSVAVAGLEQAGDDRLGGKILIDVSNPLDFSGGFPPSLTVCNTDSLGEQIQRRFPTARVVKTLNTVNAGLMVNPAAVADADHTVFVSGDDADARAQVTTWLRDWFGWRDVVDLGGISTARGTEMYLPLWVRTMSSLGTAMFSIKLVR